VISIAIGVFVSVCLFVGSNILKGNTSEVYQILGTYVFCGRGSCLLRQHIDNAIGYVNLYVFPILSMTSCFHTMKRMGLI